jgi:LysM repeat protein
MVSATTRAWAARIGAPVAFLLAVTIAVLLVRSGLEDRDAGSVQIAPPVATTRTYVVKRGDTLVAIARRFDTTVAALRRLNPDLDPTTLTVGRRIRVE